MFKLVIQDDEGKTTVVPLIRDEITIGRKEGNTIRLTERNVSRRHARILRNNGEVQIEDLGSYNGIRVNNARIAERVSLRVSDQVQIGDYKLYLKAEGIEQVDDARTMPIERIDANHGPTEVMAVPPTNGTPTMPMGALPHPNAAASPAPGAPAAAGLAGAQLVGAPNRTMVAIADTDPAGRPVASAAAVAALTAPIGYGKLVVLSSNFAGKEFELSRPQMIIGRTDENDIVINHRSISRNHAKLVREPETGRYTISDLQSSNGVRVNGQDYGKVELRRGDVVDLGHVRLRFVEAGEDFVFSRDAVVTDVPEGGSKKGLLVAVALGVLVLGGVGAYVAMSGGSGSQQTQQAGSGPSGTNDTGSGGSNVDIVAVDGDNTMVVEPAVPIDASVPAVDPALADLELECTRYAADRKWADLESCGTRLRQKDQARGEEMRKRAIEENKAETAKRKLDDALRARKYKLAKVELEKIPASSVYHKDAQSAFDTATGEAAEDYRRRAQAAADNNRCRDVDRIQREADAAGVGSLARNVSCQTVAARQPDRTNTSNTSTTTTASSTSTSTTKTEPKPDCDADVLRQRGEEQSQMGMHAAALTAFEQSLRCKHDGGVIKRAYMAACNSKNTSKAKYYFNKLSAADQPRLSQMCIRNGIMVP